MKIALLLIALMVGQGWVTTEGIDPRSITPMGVPAIRENKLTHHKGDPCHTMGAMYCSYNADVYGPVWTCADKSRVLLTAEDGTRHCIKF